MSRPNCCLFAVSAHMFQATLSSVIPKLSLLYPQLHTAQLPVFHLFLRARPLQVTLGAPPTSCSSCLRVFSIFPPKDFSNHPPLCSLIATAPLPLPLPLVCVTEITSHLSLSAHVHGAKATTPKWALVLLMSVPRPRLRSPGWLFSTAHLIWCCCFRLNPFLPGALGMKARILHLILLHDLSLTHLSNPISTPCSPFSGTSHLGFHLLGCSSCCRTSSASLCLDSSPCCLPFARFLFWISLNTPFP